MEQRPLRLGDIVDDYCPRERRITNHAIVAIVEDAIRQTRCTTCDTEHVYKHAKEPSKRRKEESAPAPVIRPAAGGAPDPEVTPPSLASPEEVATVAGIEEPAAEVPARSR